ncbi:TPA: hypothetical protein ACGVAU_001544 [Vibrio vulnificus]|uniref:hypothetical protein n=1 Tax=Vibrio vulnificus TaxID=672 RepID=UPI0004F79CF2|nr:hypothetical protein [Vibrio vulnificus]AIL71193.1 hypothetical protein VV93_v1c21150 [Vibrio vulnificus]HDY7501695.1 hypothetical protein [Vibrio vulnificus]HDY7712309.1 hypothetical protein [Vibrio vulnificus]HDY7739662.1 hypothetical protein [Vibrio vulnificus]HDY7971645.1 hypothetical protein [Vibrio vulnificus]
MKKIIVSIVGLILSTGVLAETNAGAGQKWYGPFTIEKVAKYWDGGVRMSVHFLETPNTSCDVTNSEKKVSYWNNPKAETFADSMFSAAATAQAQEKKVMILMDKTCHPIYGLNIHGVEILSH